VLASEPGLKIFIFAIEELEDFADDVGQVSIKELCIPVQVESDGFLQADLEHCGLWLL
jgi:hypothetical protein